MASEEQALDHQIGEIRDQIAGVIERLDDLVFETMRQQLHGADAKATEKRLSRSRNALRRAHALLDTTAIDEYPAE
ncbi:MAG TPA: hypothetical protein VG368_05050 [Acidimicrobiales bacterium]|jgi:formate-dependent nitrite reductase cytochrome c552 subunit|nr:hypothetical protein [Acidimicrobiales bacterium]